MINFRNKWRGHLWQGRFHSYPMDDKHFLYAAKYIEMNPVRAGLVKDPEDYPWSSAKAHIIGRDDKLVKVEPLLNMEPHWKEFLLQDNSFILQQKIRKHENTGRPLGSEEFILSLEKRHNQRLRPQKPGPKPKQ